MTRRSPYRLLCGLAAGAALLTAPAFALAPDETHVFMWKVTAPGASDGVGKPDYLIGTFHVPLEHGKNLPKVVTESLKQANLFVMETDDRAINPEVLRKYLFLPKGQDNKRFISPKSWQMILSATQPLGYGEDVVRHLEPWFLSNFVLQPPPEGTFEVMDIALRKQADRLKVPVAFLERPDEQFATLTALPRRYFYEKLNAPATQQQELNQGIKAYRAGDLTTLMAFTFKPRDVQRYPGLYQRLLYDRNDRWLGQLETMLRDKDAVVAVGLAHLVGDHSVVEALRRKGYSVEVVAP